MTSRRSGRDAGYGELGDVILCPGVLASRENVDAAMVEFEAMVEVAGLEVGGPTTAGACQRSGYCKPAMNR